MRPIQRDHVGKRSVNLGRGPHADEPSASLECDDAGECAAKRVRHASLFPVAERGGFGWGEGRARRVAGALPFSAFLRGSCYAPLASPARGFPETPPGWPRREQGAIRGAGRLDFLKLSLADAIAG
jgi:hypothetical protein